MVYSAHRTLYTTGYSSTTLSEPWPKWTTSGWAIGYRVMIPFVYINCRWISIFHPTIWHGSFVITMELICFKLYTRVTQFKKKQEIGLERSINLAKCWRWQQKETGRNEHVHDTFMIRSPSSCFNIFWRKCGVDKFLPKHTVWAFMDPRVLQPIYVFI